MLDGFEYAFGLLAVMLVAIVLIFVGLMATISYREVMQQKPERHFVLSLPL